MHVYMYQKDIILKLLHYYIKYKDLNLYDIIAKKKRGLTVIRNSTNSLTISNFSYITTFAIIVF